MTIIEPLQARMTLALISVSAITQLLGLPPAFLILSGLLLLAAWLHWLWFWPIPRGLRLMGLLGFAILIFVQFGNFFGLEPMVALFVGSLLLKLLEVRTRRDVYLLVALSLFGLATPLLFHPELWWFLAIMALALLHIALLAVLHGQRSGRDALRGAVGILWRALPLAALLFFIVPRLPPLWAVPMANHQSKTGLSETLSLGSMDSLSRDGSLAFSVRFDAAQPLPLPDERYWRSLMLVDYDGEQWMAPDIQHLRGESPPAALPTWRYQLLLSPSAQRWVPVLGTALSWPNSLEYLADGTVRARRPIHARQLFDISSDANIVRTSLGRAWWNRLTALPPDVHPLTRAYARDMAERHGDDALTAILRSFTQGDFRYTLQPAPLLGDKVDRFMFTTREGFCEHYAVAFAVMARELGYPTRVATGYLGGEASQVDPLTLMVYQYDAHAWVEIWHENQGWVRYDPTAWINPARIESPPAMRPEWRGADLPMFEELAWLLRGQRWLSQWRHATEWMNLRWMQFMADFDGAGQTAFLKRWLGEIDIPRMLMLVALVIAPGWLWYNRTWWWRRRRSLPEYYRDLLQHLALPENITPSQLAHVLSERFAHQRDWIAVECQVLQRYWFGQHKPTDARVMEALRRLRSVAEEKKEPPLMERG